MLYNKMATLKVAVLRLLEREGLNAMIIKATMDYSIQIMIEIAKADDVISSTKLSQVTDISQKYLKRIALRLKEAGLIVSVPGLHGGYSLARPASEISVLDIMLAVEDSEKLIESKDSDGIEDEEIGGPIVKSLHQGMNNLLMKYFSEISLENLLQAEKTQAGEHI